MSLDPLDRLLEKINSGDHSAAAELFHTYEPYLRMVVRRRLSPDLRAKFDSLDIVQSVWLHLLKGVPGASGRFTDGSHLRAFLVQLARHRLIDRQRRHRRAIECERPLVEGDAAESLEDSAARPDEVFQAKDLWERLLQLCPPAHREILYLKRAGALTAEVAARTGLNEGSVRRILYALSQKLLRQRSEEGKPT